VLALVVFDITELEDGSVAEGAAVVGDCVVVEEGCDHAGAASAAAKTPARAVSLGEWVMAISLVAEEVRPAARPRGSPPTMALSGVAALLHP